MTYTEDGLVEKLAIAMFGEETETDLAFRG